MVQNALVIGGGIGGLATAVALAQRGVAVTLCEQASEITEVGAGLQISPNGLVVLRALGLAGALERSGAVAATAVRLRDYARGRLVAHLDLKRLDDNKYMFVHRADLISVLHQAALRANVSIELGRKARKVTPGQMSDVQFEDGGSARTELLVCADGLNSVGRPALNATGPASFTGQVAWRATVPSKGGTPEVTVSMGPGRHIVSYPLRDGALTNIVAVQERTSWAAEGWSHKDRPENLRAAFEDFGGQIPDLLQRVHNVHFWGLFRHPVAQNWFKGGTVLVGDAAHPTLPFLAQGANMALEDAWTLAQIATSASDLGRYQAARQARTTRIVKAAAGNAWKYHLHPGPFRIAAHFGLSAASRWAPGLLMRQFDWLYSHNVTEDVL